MRELLAISGGNQNRMGANIVSSIKCNRTERKSRKYWGYDIVATLIPEISISEFRKLKMADLKRLKSVEVCADGEYIFTFVNGKVEPTGFLRTQTEFNCQTVNAVCGETLDEICGRPNES